MLTFTANLIDTAEIPRRYSSKQGSSRTAPVVTSKCKVSFVELNPFSENDMRLVKELPSIWSEGPDFRYFRDSFLHDSSSYDDVSRFFALTTQTEDVRKLNPSKILGLAKTTREYGYGYGYVNIDTIQVNPLDYFNNPLSKYKNVGKTIMNSLINLFKNETVEILAPDNFVKYFEKFDFKKKHKYWEKHTLMKLCK